MDPRALQERILKCLKEKPMTRNELVFKLKTPRTTIYDNLAKLKSIGKVICYSIKNGKRGRPQIVWDLLKINNKSENIEEIHQST